MKRFALSWRAKLSLLLLCFSVVPAVVTAGYGYEILFDTYVASTLESLKALAKAKAEAVDQFTDIRRRDVERIATLIAPELAAVQVEKQRKLQPSPKSLPKLEDAEEMKPHAPDKPPVALGDAGAGAAPSAVDPQQHGAPKKAPKKKPEDAQVPALPEVAQTPSAEVTLRRTLRLILWDQKEFEELLVIDNEGRVVASTFTDHEGHNAGAIDYFVRGRKATFVQPIFQSPITQELTTVIAAPIRDAEGASLGVLAARLNLGRFFKLINDTTGLGESGETVVGKTIDNELVFMAPTRHDADAALRRKVALDGEASRGLREASQGSQGSGEQADYRGISTFAAWQHVPSLDWGLLVKIDRSEAVSAVNSARERTLWITAVIVLLIIPTSLLAAGALVKPLRKLKEATDRISRGDFAVELNINQRDEIGQLADSFERMVAAIKFFRERSLGQESDENEEEMTGPSESPPPADSGPRD